MKTLVLGLGNPLMGDDGVGWRVAKEVESQLAAQRACFLPESTIEVDLHAGGGLSLMERLIGYDRTILIDAMDLGRTTGSVTSLRFEELPDPFAGHLASSHETNLQTALNMGKAMGVHLPQDIFLVAIESDRVYELTEAVSPEVVEAIPTAVRRVMERLNE